MALTGEYEITQQIGTLSVQWTGATLPGEITYISLFLLAVLPFLFFFRGFVSQFADRHLHIHWSPRVFGIGAPVISLVCGILLYFAHIPPQISTWELGPEGVSVNSSNGQAKINWAETETVGFDTGTPNTEKSSLILKSKDGHEVWLPLSWLLPDHQEKILSFINASTGNRFQLPEHLEEIPAPQ